MTITCINTCKTLQCLVNMKHSICVGRYHHHHHHCGTRSNREKIVIWVSSVNYCNILQIFYSHEIFYNCICYSQLCFHWGIRLNYTRLRSAAKPSSVAATVTTLGSWVYRHQWLGRVYSCITVRYRKIMTIFFFKTIWRNIKQVLMLSKH